jgi:hypothetical protein
VIVPASLRDRDRLATIPRLDHDLTLKIQAPEVDLGWGRRLVER